MAFRPEAALELIDGLRSKFAVRDYHQLPTVREDLRASSAGSEQPRTEFQRGGSLTQNARERNMLLDRMAECTAHNGAG